MAFLGNRGLQVLLSDTGCTQAASQSHKARFHGSFSISKEIQTASPVQVMNAHSGSRYGWADLLFPVKLLASVDTFLVWVMERSLKLFSFQKKAEIL